MKGRDRDTVVIVGSGMMGSGIGAMSALAGNKTTLVDVNNEKTAAGYRKTIECIRVREENGLNTREECEKAIGIVSVSTDLVSAVESTRLVIEAIVENLELKQQVFAQIDKLVPRDVTICSNTSGLQITKISENCQFPERTVTTHFWLPAHLVPLVEVVMGDKTDENIATDIVAELKKWQKSPVLVRRDLPGQLANRIFQAIIREAISIVASGLASAEDVDKAISNGMAMRFPEWGPLQHLDAIGLKLGVLVQDAVLPDICAEKSASDYLRNLVKEGHFGIATGRGFYDWKARDIEIDLKKRDAFIIEAVKLKNRLDSLHQK